MVDEREVSLTCCEGAGQLDRNWEMRSHREVRAQILCRFRAGDDSLAGPELGQNRDSEDLWFGAAFGDRRGRNRWREQVVDSNRLYSRLFGVFVLCWSLKLTRMRSKHQPPVE